MRNRRIRDWKFGSATAAVSAFSTIKGWYRADTFTGSSPNIVLTDKSTSGKNMTQVGGTMTPGTAGNGKAKFTCSAANLSSTLQIKRWPYTVITVGRRSGVTNTCFIAHTTNTSNSLWFGYDGGSNLLTSYAVGAITNATADAGVDSCWLSRRGYGCEYDSWNGTIQNNINSFGVPQGALENLSLGSSYRGMTMDWYETMIWDYTLSLAEQDEVHAYVNTRYGMSIPLWSSYTKVPQLEWAGQSNEDGRGDRGVSDVNIPVAYRGALSNVMVFDGSSTFSTMNLSTNTYFSSPNNINSLYIGPELTAAKDYADRIGQTVYVHKYAAGGTSLYYKLLDNGYWTHDHPASNQSDSFSQFRAYMTSYWKMMRVHQQNGRYPDCKSLDFGQGEDDATDATAASQYSTLLPPFINQLRIERGVGQTKLFLMRIHNAIDLGQQPYRDTVIAGQDAAALVIPNCYKYLIDSYGLRDGVHINAAGQIARGQSLATLY